MAQFQTDNYQKGMNNSSGGGAAVGEATAEGQGLANLYGTQNYESLLSGLNNTSQNYFQGPGQAASTNLGQSNTYQQQGYTTASENYRQQLGAATSLGTAGKGGSSGASGGAAGQGLSSLAGVLGLK